MNYDHCKAMVQQMKNASIMVPYQKARGRKHIPTLDDDSVIYQ